MSTYEDLFGEKFGRLVPREIVGGKGTRVYIRCECDCGKETVVRADHLLSGASQSCGCLQKEAASAANKRETPFIIKGDIAVGKTAQGMECRVFSASPQTRRKTKPVLLYSPKGGFYVGWYFGKDYRGYYLFTNRTSKDSLQYITTKVTHWMPLPEPPKEVSDETL